MKIIQARSAALDARAMPATLRWQCGSLGQVNQHIAKLWWPNIDAVVKPKAQPLRRYSQHVVLGSRQRKSKTAQDSERRLKRRPLLTLVVTDAL